MAGAVRIDIRDVKELESLGLGSQMDVRMRDRRRREKSKMLQYL